jgi:hypothetical protein
LRAGLKKDERICWPVTPRGEKATDKWAVQRYNELMRRIGITMDEDGATGKVDPSVKTAFAGI